MQTKLGKIYGNYLGWVVNHTPDPSGRMRVQVFIPHLTNTLYEGWNKNLTDKAFRNPNELGSKTLTTLQQVLPWAECAMPIFGGATSMKANATTDIVNVNGALSFEFSSAAAFGAAAGIPLDAGVNAVGQTTEQIADMPDSTSESPNESPDGIDMSLVPDIPLEPDELPSADTDLPPLASPVDEAAENPESTNGLDATQKGTNETDPQAVNFDVDYLTRDQRDTGSRPGAREIALDFNSGAGAGVGIVIPTNYTQEELNAAVAYVEQTKAWYSSLGIERGYMKLKAGEIAPGVYNVTGNGSTVSRFHTEPFAWQDSSYRQLVQNNTTTPLIYNDKGEVIGGGIRYTDVLASTLGRLPGATFIPPHEQGAAGGASDENTGLNERDFATQYLLGPLAAAKGQTLDTSSLAGGSPTPTSEDPTDLVQVNIAGNQGSVPDTTIAGNGSPNGFFSVPAYGAKVWVFFYDGDIQRPVYFASVVEPSAGQTT
jgi:hypothetical protein